MQSQSFTLASPLVRRDRSEVSFREFGWRDLWPNKIPALQRFVTRLELFLFGEFKVEVQAEAFPCV